MNARRWDDVALAVEYLAHTAFEFDDDGYPPGGERVSTPHFHASASLLVAVTMMAGGWDGALGSKFPAEWGARVEGFTPVL